VGRIRTAKDLNKLTVQLQLLQGAAAAAGVNTEALTQASASKGELVPSYPLKPLGTLQSCFTTRWAAGWLAGWLEELAAARAGVGGGAALQAPRWFLGHGRCAAVTRLVGYVLGSLPA
jgi:hypothetical protein